jgi:hypothetical protein
MGFEDKSTNNFQLTAFGNSLISTTATKYGTGAAYFDGNGDYLATNEITLSSDDFTLESWVYLTTYGAQNNTIFNQGNSDVTGAFLVFVGSDAPDQKLIFYANNVERFRSTTTISLSSWTHIAVSRQSNIYYLFVNGNLEGTHVGTYTHNQLPFKIGAGYGGVGYFNGYIDDLRITKGVARYTSTFSVPTIELLDPSDPSINNVSLLLHMNGLSGSRIFTDSSNNNFTLSAFGDTQISLAQKKFNNSSGFFDGTGDYLEAPLNSAFEFGTGDFTIEMWVYPTRTGFHTCIARWSSGGNNAFFISVDTTSGIAVYINDASPAKITGGTIVANQWQHIALTRQGASVKAFINGIQAGSTFNIGTAAINSSTNKLRIGYDHFGNLFFQGYIDEVRVTKGVARYTSNFTTPTSPFPNTTTFPLSGLLAFWPLNEASRTRYDISGNGRHLADRNNNVTGVPGLTFNAAQFTGVTTKTLSSANNFPIGNTQPFTLSMWLNYTTYSSSGTRIITVNPAADGAQEWGIVQDGTSLGVFNNYGSGRVAMQITGSARLSAGQWEHLVVTKDSSYTWKYYKNGTLLQTTANNSTNWIAQNTAAVFLGQNIYGFTGDGPPNGLVDAVGIWNRVLTDQEISTLYNSGNGLEI